MIAYIFLKAGSSTGRISDSNPKEQVRVLLSLGDPIFMMKPEVHFFGKTDTLSCKAVDSNPARFHFFDSWVRSSFFWKNVRLSLGRL